MILVAMPYHISQGLKCPEQPIGGRLRQPRGFRDFLQGNRGAGLGQGFKEKKYFFDDGDSHGFTRNERFI
jgi:hypothetical protein